MNNNLLIGAATGDIVGSVYEGNTTHKIGIDFVLFHKFCEMTDDTVLTIATMDCLLNGGKDYAHFYQKYGQNYYDRGFGRSFRKWMYLDEPTPYGSYGNGSAMRVSPVGWAFDDLEETLAAAKRSAEVTHNHPEGIKGAQATAACIFLARNGKSKKEIKEYIEATFNYDLDRTCDTIRPTYMCNVSCQGCVPEAIIAFLESTDFENAIRLAISLGGDTDTIGAICGSMAEAYYKEIPSYIREEVMKRLPKEFIEVMQRFDYEVVRFRKL